MSKKASKVTKLPKMEETKIVIPQPTTMRLLVGIKGKTPLIMHNFGNKSREEIRRKQAKKATKGKVARNPKQEYEDAFYRDEDGDAAMPVVNFKAAMLRVYKIAGFSNKNEIRFGVFFPGTYTKIEGFPRMVEDVVRLGGMTAPADLRYRPYFDEWAAELEVELNTDVISVEQFLNAFTKAGTMCGVGDWRPEKSPGNYGCWTVESVVAIEETQ